MFFSGLGRNEELLQRTFHRGFLPSFGLFGQAASEDELKKLANQKQESPVPAMFFNGLGRNEQCLQRTFHRGFLPSFRLFGQVVSEEMN
jgi:hypothetical protein